MQPTPKQIAYLEAHGIDFTSQTTRQQASQLISEYQERHDDDDEERHPFDVD